jgi:Na+-transporting NADH:ubiquinone oxidoreductase subunit NqrA
MRHRFKAIVNIEIEDPEAPFPAGCDYTHLSRIEGVVKNLVTSMNYWPAVAVRITLDKLIDKGKIPE